MREEDAEDDAVKAAKLIAEAEKLLEQHPEKIEKVRIALAQQPARGSSTPVQRQSGSPMQDRPPSVTVPTSPLSGPLQSLSPQLGRNLGSPSAPQEQGVPLTPPPVPPYAPLPPPGAAAGSQSQALADP